MSQPRRFAILDNVSSLELLDEIPDEGLTQTGDENGTFKSLID